MDILAILELFGGVGLFLFGMSLMGSSLEKLAGGSLNKILEKLTTGKTKAAGHVKGWALGLGVTGIIQSSAATTIMLIGFVNAGIMQLAQAVPVVFGANVGSTVTAQILRLGDLGTGSIVLSLLKPSAFAPMLCAVGAAMHLFSKKKMIKEISSILAGLGILFYGMNAMEEVFMPLRESEKFRSFFTSFENPLVGILAGLLITAVIQSSSASVGILQALSATGSVTFATAIPIIIGQNIGKCMTILLGGIGANKKAKRVSVSYLLFNIFGALLFSVAIYTIYYTVGIPFFEKACNRGDIANIHLGFNLITSLLLLPFSEKIANLTGKLLRDTDEAPVASRFARLDDMLLKTPSVALAQVKEIVSELATKLKESFTISTDLISDYREEAFDTLNKNEDFIDQCETVLSSYILRINRKRLSADEGRTVTEILNSISDLERMGDYCMNIAYTAKEMQESGLTFSDTGARELHCIVAASAHSVDATLNAFLNDDGALALRVEPLTEVIDKLKELIRSHHIDRLQTGDCSIAGGVALFDIITSLERLAAHASNIALHTIKRTFGKDDFDEMHGHASDRNSEEYKALYYFYEAQYYEPVINLSSTKAEKQPKQSASGEPLLIAEKPSKQAKPEKQKKTDKAEKIEKQKKAEKAEKVDKTEKVKKDDKVKKPENPEKPEKTEKPKDKDANKKKKK